jgi:hypothetical protein
VVNADVVRYVIEDGDNWEIGTGTYTASGTTLSRTVVESSNANAALNLTGDAVVFITAAAADILQPGDNISELTNDSGFTTNTGTVTSVSGTGTKNGLTLTGTVTTSGNLTLGGTLSISNNDWSGTDLSVANGGTGASSFTANNVLLGNGTSSFQTVAPGTSGNVLTSNGTTWTSAGAPVSAVQYPQESKSENYTLVLADAGKQIFHPASDNLFRTFTIPANSSVAFPIGTVVLFTAENGAQPINVAINSDTLVTNKSITGSVVVDSGNTLYCIKTAATKWQAYYLFQTSITPSIDFAIAAGHSNSPFLSAYPWGSSGFGTKFSNPATLPSGNSYDVAFTPAGDAIAVGNIGLKRLEAYSFSSSGFGTKFADLGFTPTDRHRVSFSPNGNFLASTGSQNNFNVVSWSSSSGFGGSVANVSPFGSGAIVRGVAFSPSGDAVVVVGSNAPYVTAYPFNSTTGALGTEFPSIGLSIRPNGTCYGVSFSPAGDAVAVAHGGTGAISVYGWSSSGFGTKFANPASPPASGLNVVFSPLGDSIIISQFGSPYIAAYPWSSSGFGTRFTNPSVGITGSAPGLAISPAGDAVAVLHINTPYITAYPFSSSGFGTKFTNPAVLPVHTFSTDGGLDFALI